MVRRTLLPVIALTLVSTSVRHADVRAMEMDAQLRAPQPDAVWHFKAGG